MSEGTDPSKMTDRVCYRSPRNTLLAFANESAGCLTASWKGTFYCDLMSSDRLMSGTNEQSHNRDHQVYVRLAGLENTSSQLSSVTSFEELGLKEEILRGLYAMGYSKPSKIQERALPLLLAEPPRNMIGQSQSGTGKTAAFSLNILSRIDTTLYQPQAIVLAPSRELARQIQMVIERMAKFTATTTCLVVKGQQPRGYQIQEHVVIGTPGSVMDTIRRRALTTKHIKVFVLDEADNMLDQSGLGDQSIRIKTMLECMPQIVLFSATFPENVRKFAPRFAPDANEISLRREELSVDSIKQFYMDCKSEEHKYEVLCNLYDLLTVSQSIIFCRKRDTADEIARRMTEQGHSVKALHGMMSPEERDYIMDEFRRGVFKVLITTNVISRGIDILQVSLVINYDMPLDINNNPDPETYLHRVGRTGRFGRTGVSINFVHDRRSWEQMRVIEDHFQKEIKRVQTDDWEQVEKTLNIGITRAAGWTLLSSSSSSLKFSVHFTMSDDNVTVLAQKFQQLRGRPGKYGGGEYDEEIDSPDGEKFRSLGDQLGLPGTPAAQILSHLGKPDELTPTLQHSAGVPVMPGPAISGGSEVSATQQQPPYYLVYYWRQKHDYLYFKIDPVKETVITSDWHKTEE
ncbi:hypothetical protein VTP01DRAFT_2623 [Rhizomucor pusillus]|uniref:uncharacterized protein n=1 Tax=Rhizomucor pusillus TaxID=4840 RepID=UPI003742D7C4